MYPDCLARVVSVMFHSVIANRRTKNRGSLLERLSERALFPIVVAKSDGSRRWARRVQRRQVLLPCVPDGRRGLHS